MIMLVVAGLVDIGLTIVLFSFWKKNRHIFEKSKERYWIWQIFVGVLFGFSAIFATEFAVEINGAAMNIRDAAPLCAGLIFGGPAGIIAGMIGGYERAMAIAWGVGTYTQVACSMATFLSGIFAALLRKFIFDSKIPTIMYGFFSGIVMETIHMLMVFLTHMDDIANAFKVVQVCTIPMITLNALAVMASILMIRIMSDESLRKPWGKQEIKRISQSFQRALLMTISIAFVITCFFVRSTQTNLARNNTESQLNTNISDVYHSITDTSDENLLRITHEVTSALGNTSKVSTAQLNAQLNEFDVAEINAINEEGVITASTHQAFIGYDMSDGQQSAEFLVLLDGRDEFVQEYRATSNDSSLSRKYAGVKTPDGFIQVGYDADRFQRDIDAEVTHAAENRHVGNSGYLIIANDRDEIISGRYKGKTLDAIGLDLRGHRQGETLTGKINNEKSSYMYKRAEGYTIIAAIPEEEVVLSRELSTYLEIFMQTLVFTALFILIYYLVRRRVVDQIQKINDSLAEITGGNLDTRVDVRSAAEFASLSDDINSTVVTLKRYIAEAAARIDKELEFAKQIQESTLPDPEKFARRAENFNIYATMDAAKEVGGDFYDFYYIDDDHLVITIADVSGKGIPAAMFMMRAKATLKGFAEENLPINEIFQEANHQLCEGNESGLFVTVWMGILELSTGLIKFSTAGHNPPVIMKPDGSSDFYQARPGLVLAGMDGVPYRQYELQLEQGDRILLYTDGVTEATSADVELYGDPRLLKVTKNCGNKQPKDICRIVREDLDEFVGDAPQFDDITMLCLVYQGEEGDPVIEEVTEMTEEKDLNEITVEATTENIDTVTAFVEERLEAVECPMKVIMQVNIAIDEIFGNISNYAYNPEVGAATVRVEVCEDPMSVKVTFVDHGVQYDPLAKEDPDTTLSAEDRQIGGLGVFMVKNIMDDVSYEYVDGQNILTIRKVF